jgi:hypothetical protein
MIIKNRFESGFFIIISYLVFFFRLTNADDAIDLVVLLVLLSLRALDAFDAIFLLVLTEFVFLFGIV